MAQVRREPRFNDIEVLAPVKIAGQPARRSIDMSDISDAVFETIGGHAPAFIAAGPAKSAQQRPIVPAGADGLGILKQNVPFDAVAYSNDSALSPGFLAFTLFSAFGVFWLCGGHALLY